MDMSNEINGILKVNDKKDVNLDKLNDKIKEKENYYITGDVLYSPQKKMTDLYNAQSYQEFSRRLSELKHQGSIFAMVFSASGILATFQTESNQDGKLEITHQDIVLKDLDPNNQLHSELVCISGQSSWTLVHKAFEASGSAAKGKPSQTTFFGKLGSCSIILSNSTFNRICKLL